jgi:hypothetical protein
MPGEAVCDEFDSRPILLEIGKRSAVSSEQNLN